MDQSLLVKVGQNLLTYLEREGADVDAAVWIFDPDARWQLWLAPKTYVSDHAFYLALAQVLAKYRQQIGDLEISEVRVLEPGNPLVSELKKFRQSAGTGFPRLADKRAAWQAFPAGGDHPEGGLTSTENDRVSLECLLRAVEGVRKYRPEGADIEAMEGLHERCARVLARPGG